MIWVAACIFVTVIVSLLFIAGIIFWQARKDDVGIVFNAVGLFLCLAAGTVITTHVNNLQEIEQITNREKVENVGFNYLFKGEKGDQICLYSDGDQSLEETDAAGYTQQIYCEDKP